ncbi:MAG: hypothetical protein HRU26_14915 [Psychroserpens sp.]|nr:hypothetical protein [Psychroserpens sp.]
MKQCSFFDIEITAGDHYVFNKDEIVSVRYARHFEGNTFNFYSEEYRVIILNTDARIVESTPSGCENEPLSFFNTHHLTAFTHGKTEGEGLKSVAQERKDTPVYSGFMKYFPLAIAEVARCSKAGNDQHNPGKPLHWDRSKSGDELDALSRHLLEAGTTDTDGILHSAKVAWRAMANLEKELENKSK